MKAYKKVSGISPYRVMASANKRSCHRMICSTMLPVNEPTPNTTSPGLPALIRIPVGRIIVRPPSPVKFA
jgi:hypothetical protein